MERDRETIGLSAEAEGILGKIEQRNWFGDKQDIARFCLAYAIRAKVCAGTTADTETRWASGNFDKNGEISTLLAALYPDCKTPIRLMEHLVNEGLRLVGRRLSSETTVGPADLMNDE